MPHSESQVIDLVRTSSAFSVPSVGLSASKINNDAEQDFANKISTATISPRPPLPPKIPKNNSKKFLPTPNQVLRKNDSQLSIGLSTSRSTTPNQLDISSFSSLSRDSSCRNLNTRLRSFSPSLSSISRSSSFESRTQMRSLTPRRIFPQIYQPSSGPNIDEISSMDQATTVFDGKLSFLLGCSKQRVRQDFRPLPAHSSDAETASRFLTDKIADFLKRTDHVNEEWNNHCLMTSNKRHRDLSLDSEHFINSETNKRLTRSKSVANIILKGYQMSKNMPPTERSNSLCRQSIARINTSHERDFDEETVCDEEVKIITTVIDSVVDAFK